MDRGLQYAHLYAPRKLRESVNGVNQDGEILLAFEKDGYAQISLIRVNLEWLTDGGDQVEPIDGNR